MKKTFIFISLSIIWIIALIDVINIIEKSKVATARTPSQIEIKPPINSQNMKMFKPEFDNNNINKQNIHKKLQESTKTNLQNRINNMNNQTLYNQKN